MEVFIGFMEDRLHSKRNLNLSNSLSATVSEGNHVRKLIDRLECSSSSSDTKKDKKISMKKTLHEDHSDGSTSLTSSPPVKRVARSDYNEKKLFNGSHDAVSFRNNSSNEIKFELNREELNRKTRRTASGTSVSFYFQKKNCSTYLDFR